VHALTQGLTNKSFLLKSGQQQLVLRINAINSHALDLDRSQELKFHRAAENLGLSPPLLYAAPDQSYMVKEYVAGETWQLSDSRSRGGDQIDDIADTLKQIQSLSIEAKTINYFRKIERYWNQATTVNADIKSQFKALVDRARLFFENYDAEVEQLVPCHHDTVIENIILSDRKITLLDWEYAALGDPWFDLVVFSESAQLNTSETHRLIQRYCEGKVTDEHANYRFSLAQQNFYYLDFFWHCAQGANLGALLEKEKNLINLK